MGALGAQRYAIALPGVVASENATTHPLTVYELPFFDRCEPHLWRSRAVRRDRNVKRAACYEEFILSRRNEYSMRRLTAGRVWRNRLAGKNASRSTRGDV